MQILKTNVYVGPNLYANFPVIRHQIDLGPLEEWPSGRLGERFIGRLLEALPGLHEHGCSYGEPGGFVRRMTEDNGTWLGHIWEHLAIEMQCAAGSEVSFGKTRSTGETGQYNLIYEYRHRSVGLEAGELAQRLLLHALPEEAKVALYDDIQEKARAAFDWDSEWEHFVRYAQRYQLGPSTKSLVEAARKRGIPHLRLNDYSLVQLGQGVHQKRLQATITSETRHIAVDLAGDKEETNRLLEDLGLPVPKQDAVYTEDAAVDAAERLGYPVVVKPLDANHGRGVSTELESPDGVRHAFESAQAFASGSCVLVERCIPGFDHRLLVVGEKLVAAAKRVPGHVVGDGEQTIQELVDEVNADPRRGVGHEKVLTQLEFDAQAIRLMEEKGYTRETVLSEGEVFYLRTTANLSTGGTAIDVTDIIHPDNREMAVRAVQAIGLDVGGVDFLCEDISESYKTAGGAIVEVNAAPGFRMHVAPSEGKPRDVAGPVIDMLYPPGTPSRIPIAAITGTNGKTTTSRMLAHIVKSAGKTVGLTSTDGVYIDGQLTVEGDMTGPVSTQMVLRDPNVDAAVLEMARGGLLRSGMGVKWCDVGACLNVSADHLGLKGINTLDELAEVKRIVPDAARGTAVLNADDDRCLEMAEDNRAEHICLISMDASNNAVREHIRDGGRAVVLEEGMGGNMITLYDGGAHIPMLWAHLIPATLEGKAIHNVQNAMFAAAMAYSMEFSLESIRHGLLTFATSYFQTPGRLNVYDELPFRVILDYAHNPAAMGAMRDLVQRLDVRGAKRVVMAAPGDRRDEDIRAVAEQMAGVFDAYICREDDDRRGRDEGEVAEMLRDGLLASGEPEASVELVLDEQEAVQAGLTQSAPGDLLVIFGDNVRRSWDQIVHFGGQASSAKTHTEHAPGNAILEAPPAKVALYDTNEASEKVRAQHEAPARRRIRSALND